MENLLKQIEQERQAFTERIQKMLEPHLNSPGGVDVNVSMYEGSKGALDECAKDAGWELKRIGTVNCYVSSTDFTELGDTALFLKKK